MKKIYFSGINGIGMSGLAMILKDLGYEVLGSDLEYKNISEKLEEKGIEVFIGQKKENLIDKNIDTFVYSTAIKEDNEEYLYSKSKNMNMLKRGKLLANIMNEFKKGIAVAGTHGKTTTSSMLAVSFLQKDPYIVIGGILPEISSNSKIGSSEYFIAEADESDNSFLEMYPYYSIITNIEADHLDFHGNFDNIVNSFRKFISQTKNKVICCYDCNIVKNLKDDSDKMIYYSIYEENKEFVSIYSKNILIRNGITYFDVVKDGIDIGTFKLSVPGLHNVSNALSVIYIALSENLNIEIVKEMLFNFKGANRRYQILYDNNIKIIDDYAHHPTEIEATIKAASINENKNVIAVFEPHRYTRTYFFMNDFAKSLRFANEVILLPIYSANEKNEYNISSNDLSKLIGDNSRVLSKEELEKNILENSNSNNVYLFMGAGSISYLAHKIVGSLKNENI